MGGNTFNSDTLTEAIDLVKELSGAQRIQRLYTVRYNFGKKELVTKPKEIKELDLVMEV